MINNIELHSYYNSSLGISILVPNDWGFTVVNDSKIRLFGNFEDGYKDFFEEYRPSISFEIIKLEETIDFKDLHAGYSSLKRSDYNNYELISELDKKLLNKYYYESKFSWTDESTNIKIYQKQGFVESGINSYISFNSSVFEKYSEKYEALFNLILGSMRIIPNKL